jgi:uncharacterized protein (DUF433 family)
MTTLIAVRGVEPWRRRLYLPAYQVSEAAKYVDLSPQVVASWYFRETKTGVTLPGKELKKPLSYLQLIELAVVSIFRKLGVPLVNIRRARQYLAQNFHSEYPFAEYNFKTEGYHLLMDLQQFEAGAEMKLIVADKNGQLAWEPLMEDRLLEFDYENNLVLKWHLAGRKSRVLIDPRVAFGAPTVSGLPTWILKGRYQSGETLEDIREDFPIDEVAIKDGLAFEGITLAG